MYISESYAWRMIANMYLGVVREKGSFQRNFYTLKKTYRILTGGRRVVQARSAFFP